MRFWPIVALLCLTAIGHAQDTTQPKPRTVLKPQLGATPMPGDDSPAMREARQLDKEAAAERADEDARSPEVAKELYLPDESSVFALDQWQGEPELAELPPTETSLNHDRHGGLPQPILSRRTAPITLDGAAASVQLHTRTPALFISLDDAPDVDEMTDEIRKQPVPANVSPDVGTHKRGAASARSSFAIMQLDAHRTFRVLPSIPLASVTKSVHLMPSIASVMPGGHWVRVAPIAPLAPGPYALIELLPQKELGAMLWDFEIVVPTAENPTDAN